MKHSALCPLILTLSAPAPAGAWPFVPRPFPAGPDGNSRPLAADFRGNGRLMWYCGGTRIASFPSPGADITLPAITLPQIPSAAPGMLAATVCDVDGDGDSDIVRINDWNVLGDNFTLQVFLNNGAGTFTPGYRRDWTDSWNYDEGNHYYELEAADFDRDGDTDLAVLATYQNPEGAGEARVDRGSLKIWWNAGSGTFPAASTLQSYLLSGTRQWRDGAHLGGRSLVAADMDRDGDTDLLCLSETTFPDPAQTRHSIKGFRNGGSGGFTAFKVGLESLNPLSVWVRDQDADGWPDLRLAVTDYPYANNFAIRTFQSDGAGGFGAMGSENDAKETLTGDFDEQGPTDEIGRFGNGIKLRSGSGTAAWTDVSTFAAPVVWTCPGDTDGDGDEDLFVKLQNGACYYLENTALHRWSTLASSANHLNVPGATRLRSADFDSDGRADLLALSPASKAVALARGTGVMGFAPPAYRTTEFSAAGDFAVADMNQDSLPDYVYTLPGTGQVRQTLNNGLSIAGWTDALLYSQPGAQWIATGSMGRNSGWPDVAVAGNVPVNFSWYRNPGAGGAWSKWPMLASGAPDFAGILTFPAGGGGSATAWCLSREAAGSRVRGYTYTNGVPAAAGDVLLPSPGAGAPVCFTRGDVTGDRREDIVFVDAGNRLSAWTPGTPASAVVSLTGTAYGDIREMVCTDWNRDGRTDILCAGSAGLTIYRELQGQWIAHQRGLAGGCVSLAAGHFNEDRWPDVAAVAADGEISLYRNPAAALYLMAENTPEETPMEAGAVTRLMDISATNPGRPADPAGLYSAEPAAALESAVLSFHRLKAFGGTWVLDRVLTASEVQEAVERVDLVRGSTVVARGLTSGMDSSATLTLQHSAPAATVAAGDTAILRMDVKLKATAAQASYDRFLLAVNSVNTRAVDGRSPAETALYEGRPVRILITPAYSPLEKWRLEHFGSTDGTGPRADDADYDRDGTPNLVEYAAGGDPASAAPSTALRLLPLSPGQPAKFTVTLSDAALADPALTVTVEQTDSLKIWGPAARRQGGGAWTVLAPTYTIPQTGGLTTHYFTTAISPGQIPKYFLRLKATYAP